MSLLDFIKNKEVNEQSENATKILAENAASIVKELSGSYLTREKKLIDNYVVVSSASGGAGASTLVANIAYSACKRGLNVCVIDMNIQYPSQHIYFNVEQKIETPDLIGYLSGVDKINDIIEKTGYKNISLIRANNRGILDHIGAEGDVQLANYEELIQKLRKLFDFVIVDVPMEVEHALHNMAFYIADQIYLVWDEGISSITNTERLRRNMAFSGIESYAKIRIILNKRTNIGYSMYPFKKLNLKLVETLPFDIAIIESSLKGQVFCDKGASKNETARLFCERVEALADKILALGGYN